MVVAEADRELGDGAAVGVHHEDGDRGETVLVR
jgi:hypothetical protein